MHVSERLLTENSPIDLRSSCSLTSKVKSNDPLSSNVGALRERTKISSCAPRELGDRRRNDSLEEQLNNDREAAKECLRVEKRSISISTRVKAGTRTDDDDADVHDLVRAERHARFGRTSDHLSYSSSCSDGELPSLELKSEEPSPVRVIVVSRSCRDRWPWRPIGNGGSCRA